MSLHERCVGSLELNLLFTIVDGSIVVVCSHTVGTDVLTASNEDGCTGDNDVFAASRPCLITCRAFRLLHLVLGIGGKSVQSLLRRWVHNVKSSFLEREAKAFLVLAKKQCRTPFTGTRNCTEMMHFSGEPQEFPQSAAQFCSARQVSMLEYSLPSSYGPFLTGN